MAVRSIVTTIAALAGLAVSPAMADNHQAIGTWINPRGTVKVQTTACGARLCGKVVWASSVALADAKSSGVDTLIGVELLRDYHSTGPNRYVGKVYVPDMGRVFYSTITQVDPATLRISGCILGGLICKTQTWRRV